MNRIFLRLAFPISLSIVGSFPQCVNAQFLPPARDLNETPVPKTLEPLPTPIQKPLERLQLPEVEIPSLTVKRFFFIDNKIFSSKELENLLTQYLNKKLSLPELRKVRDIVTDFYIQSGHINSGAALLIKDNPRLNVNGDNVYIRVIEGKVNTLKVSGSSRLSRYVRDRLKQDKAFNYNLFTKSVFLLQDDPLLSDIKVSLEPSKDLINVANLDVKIKAAKAYKIEVFADNYRNPSVGSFERGIEFTALNPLTLGDKVNFTYRNTNGSDSLAANYTVPITKENTTLRFAYLYGNNEIIENPFNGLGLNGISQIYSLGIRHPLLRTTTEKNRSELAISLSIDHLENQDQLLGFGFPVSRGSNDTGQIKTTVLRFAQEWQYRDVSQFAFLRSQFSLGLDIGSITAPAFDNGQFFAWRGDTIWSRKLPAKLVFVSKAGLQFSDRLLVSSEQLSAGGETVRGYRQDGALGDNGFLGSLEVKIPIFEGSKGRLGIAPFFDVGYVWDNAAGTHSNLLASTGLSLRYDFSDRLSANLTWGIPLTGVSGERRSVQEQGVLFSLRWLLF
jgi:hemolysin activation/secretion protein